LILLLAGDARTATAWKADGWHGRRNERNATGRALHSAPAHNLAEIVAVCRSDADALFLSPLFPTCSHPGGTHLGRIRFAALAHQARMPVMALGGVKRGHRHMLRSIGADGWAAIDGLVGPHPL
jgi:thiamine-phosphate pyrophosphorylase